MPSAKEPAYATTPSTGRPISSATSPRASTTVPPPWPSTKPPRRRSLGRQTWRSSMPLASICGGVGGGAHVAEAEDALDAEVVEAAGDDHAGLVEADLVDALLDADRGRGAGGDRVHHRAVPTEVGLHGVRRDDVGQRLLEDVVRRLLTEQRVDVHLPGGLHAADAGALGVGELGRVDPAQQLGRLEAARDERVDRGHEVPGREPVDRLHHRARGPTRAGRTRRAPGRRRSARA